MVITRAIAMAILPAILMLTACSGGSLGNSNRMMQSAVMPGTSKLSDAQIIANAQNNPKVQAMLPKMVPGTRVLYLSSVTISDNGNTATFPATARINLANNKLSVFDPQSGQTFTFSASSRISYLRNGTKVYVRPGMATPSWVSPGAIEKSEVLK